MKKAVLLCLISYILGIAAVDALDVSTLVFVCISAILASAVKCIFIGKRVKCLPIVMCTFFVFGIVYTSSIYCIKTDRMYPLVGEQLLVSGRIVSEARTDSEYYDKYEIDVYDAQCLCDDTRSVYNADKRLTLSLKKYNLKQPAPTYKYGDVVSIEAELGQPSPPLNEGDIDYANASRADGLFFNLDGSYDKSIILYTKLNYFDLYDLAAVARAYCTKVLDKHFTGDEASLLKGILLSEKTFTDEYRGKLSASGMAHITVASGLHTGCVFAVILWLCFACGIRKKWTYMIAAVVLWAFAFLQGMTPSIIRAVTMLCFYMGAQLAGRDYDKEHILYITAFIMLLINPYAIFDLSFVFSFVSVLGIVMFAQIFYEYIVRVVSFKRLASFVSVTLAAQVLMLPLLAFYFNEVSRYSFWANFLIVPIMTAVLMIGFVFFAVGGLGAVLPSCVAFVLGLLAKYINGVINAISLLPNASVDIYSMDIVQMCMYYLLVAAAYCYFTKGCKKYNFVPLGICGAIAVCALAGNIFVNSFMSVSFINVGQADAALIKIPYGKTVVIDGGGSSPISQSDVGERIFVPYLRRNGVNTVDYAVLSHYDKDHAQGIAALLRDIRVKNLVLPYRERMGDNEYKDIIEMLAGYKNVNVMYFKEGDTFQLGGAVFEAFAPEQKVAKNKLMSENNKSLVMKLSYGHVSFLFTGDIEEEVLGKLIKHGEEIRADVLKVPHHGSNTSISSKFIKTILPKYGIISVGKDNSYNLPSHEAIDILTHESVDIYRTDECGTISFYASSGGIAWIDMLYDKPSEEQIFLRSGARIWLKNPQQQD